MTDNQNLPAPAEMINSNIPMLNPAYFEQMQRVGRMLAVSPLFPQHLRNGGEQAALANGVLVVNMAMRLQEDPLTVAQNIYFVGGKPGWSSSYMIGKANQHGVFRGSIDWKVTGRGDDLSVTAFATVKDTGERVQATCDMAMARAEGWVKNPKYKSMPEQMLRYRSACFLIRLYCPEVMIGMPVQAEIEMGMKDVTPEDAAQTITPARSVSDVVDPDDAVVAKPTPNNKATAKPAPEAPAQDEKPEAEKKPAAKAEPDPEQFQMLANSIMADAQEMGEVSAVDSVAEFYADQITQMKTSAPEIHKDLIKRLDEMRKEFADGDGGGE